MIVKPYNLLGLRYKVKKKDVERMVRLVHYIHAIDTWESDVLDMIIDPSDQDETNVESMKDIIKSRLKQANKIHKSIKLLPPCR